MFLQSMNSSNYSIFVVHNHALLVCIAMCLYVLHKGITDLHGCLHVAVIGMHAQSSGLTLSANFGLGSPVLIELKWRSIYSMEWGKNGQKFIHGKSFPGLG